MTGFLKSLCVRRTLVRRFHQSWCTVVGWSVDESHQPTIHSGRSFLEKAKLILMFPCRLVWMRDNETETIYDFVWLRPTEFRTKKTSFQVETFGLKNEKKIGANRIRSAEASGLKIWSWLSRRRFNGRGSRQRSRWLWVQITAGHRTVEDEGTLVQTPTRCRDDSC